FPNALLDFLSLASCMKSVTEVSVAFRVLANAIAPIRLIADLKPAYSRVVEDSPERDELLLTVCVATLRGSQVTEVLVLRPNEAYSLGLTVWLSSWPEWADNCVVEPLSHLNQSALSLPKFTFSKPSRSSQQEGLLLEAQELMHCRIEQPVGDPA